jgi:ATP-dependent Clp protease ATP-binding subunit ClpC
MNFNIPIYIKETYRSSADMPLYEIRPLFVDGFVARHQLIRRAMTLLAKDVRKELYHLVRNGENDMLMLWSFSPEMEDHRYKVTLQLHRRTAKCQFFVIAFKSLDRKLAFTPIIPDLWFEVKRGQSLRDRSVEVFTHYFREQEKQDKEVKPEKYALKGKAWVTTLDIEIYLAGFKEKTQPKKFAFLGSSERLWGARELDNTGECLDWLFPDELSRAILRDEQVEELSRLLEAPDKRPVMLVGSRGSGKTTILHEYIYRTVTRRRKKYAVKKNVWHLSPQRLVSGMMFVGQWEDRLLAIVREAHKRGHVLFFDDLLGLYLAGITAQSELTVAHVLKPLVERREFRMLAEITPESLQVLQEKDRGFADLFHIIPVKETDENHTLRILLNAMRQLEGQKHCVFDVDVIPAVMDLQRRYVHDRVFPGKAVDFLNQLAVKKPNSRITRLDVLAEFQAQSGLSVTFLDRRQKFSRNDVLNGLRKELVGQNEAVHAVTDVICKARARLNDPDRPLGTFLFLGPTGVGKTQCAKTVASQLFGDPERLVRFDMNTYIDAWSVPKLMGTFKEPEGLLTSQVQRQPFCVLLFDEIEKAHADVFDLLLQVLGEGRLTNALGKTVDFTNAIIIMTSNLGVREARSQLGFQSQVGSGRGTYVDVAEKFFRPEFFNRLDRIVPFVSLSRQSIEEVARKLIGDMFQRHGLRQRECALEVSQTAMNKIVQEGYHPDLGARALKRVIERQLTQPVSSRLAEFRPGTPTVISVYAAPEGIAVSTQVLIEAETIKTAPIDLSDPILSLERAKAALQRFESKTLAMEPEGPISSEKINPEYERYLSLSEQLRYVRAFYDRLAEQIHRPQTSSIRQTLIRRPRRSLKSLEDYWRVKPIFAELFLVKEIEDQLQDMWDQAEENFNLKDRILELYLELALLETMMGYHFDGQMDRVLLCMRQTAFQSFSMYNHLFEMYGRLFDRLWGFSLSPVDKSIPNAQKPYEEDGTSGLIFDGPGVSRLAQLESGTHIFRDNEGQFGVVKMVPVPLSPQEDPVERFLEMRRDRRQWLEDLEAGRRCVEDDPFGFDSVIRLYEPWGVTVDFRTGLVTKGMPTEREFRRFLLSQLVLPDELTK